MNGVASDVMVSVIIPVYKDWALIEKALAALSVQTLPKFQFEIIVVNNEKDGTVPTVVTLPDNARVVTEPRPGSYSARNAGVEKSKGELLIFTDADCQPYMDWLEKMYYTYQRYGDCLIAGGVDVQSQKLDEPNRYEVYDMVLGLPQERYVKRGYAVTANLAVPRTIYDAVGGFDARRYSGGDADFCRRAVAMGYSLKYEGTAKVIHPARDSWVLLETKIRRVKGGQLLNGCWQSRTKYFIKSFVPPLRALFNILKSNTRFKRKITAIWVLFGVWKVEMKETIRLLMGRKPERK